MLLNEGVYNGKRFLSRPNAFILTRSNQIGKLYGGEKGENHYSLTFNVITKTGEVAGKGSEGTFSWGGYFNTNYWADPKEQIIAVLMKQTRGLRSDPSEAIFTRMIYQSIDD
jgi:CubicO group peptidase (beta-lactamase class C family)